MNNNIRSFVSADVDIPVKLLQPEYIEKFLHGKFSPIHIQIYPTNLCNLNCDFCSCAGRKRKEHIDLDKLRVFVETWRPKSATISGGGEPLMYNEFSDMVYMLKYNKVSIGMATNGYLLRNYDDTMFDKFEWIRISISKISLSAGLIPLIKEKIENAKKCDWAFSYVCSPNLDINEKVVKEFYDIFHDKVTHFRVVGDILVSDDRVDRLKERFDSSYENIIWQGRNSFGVGNKKCLLSKIKPVLSADNKVYSCCGAQYAIKGKERDLPEELCLGGIDDLTIFKNTLDGSICDKCYYNGYNTFLNYFVDDIRHGDFI